MYWYSVKPFLVLNRIKIQKSPDFYNKITFFVDMDKSVDIVCLDFSKAFNRISHNIFLEKLVSYRMGRWSAGWVGNWLTCCTQKVVIKGFYSCWQPVTNRIPQGQILGHMVFDVFINPEICLVG